MKVKIKLSRRHPNDYMNFFDHVITYEEKEFNLSEDEVKQLSWDGPKHWFVVSEVNEAPKKEPKKQTKKKSSKKAK